jgi:hypothetical protein
MNIFGRTTFRIFSATAIVCLMALATWDYYHVVTHWQRPVQNVWSGYFVAFWYIYLLIPLLLVPWERIISRRLTFSVLVVMLLVCGVKALANLFYVIRAGATALPIVGLAIISGFVLAHLFWIWHLSTHNSRAGLTRR